jgi:hypothetical protein
LKGDWKFIGMGLEKDGRILMRGSYLVMGGGDNKESAVE